MTTEVTIRRVEGVNSKNNTIRRFRFVEVKLGESKHAFKLIDKLTPLWVKDGRVFISEREDLSDPVSIVAKVTHENGTAPAQGGRKRRRKQRAGTPKRIRDTCEPDTASSISKKYSMALD